MRLVTAAKQVPNVEVIRTSRCKGDIRNSHNTLSHKGLYGMKNKMDLEETRWKSVHYIHEAQDTIMLHATVNTIKNLPIQCKLENVLTIKIISFSKRNSDPWS
jgi:hypothetical protein